MAIRPLLIGLSLIFALVLVILSILLVNPSQPMRESEGLMPNQQSPSQQ
ncbi:hypothetical protein [Neorhizobium sp. P12A]|jgi:hypothetical protein|nr:hypothetical protein [Neorhizobium sp. P12A]TCR82484.1 hypothetical protein EV561_110147 [Rhizobium sp. BK376]